MFTQNQKKTLVSVLFFKYVPGTGFEPAPPCEDYTLNVMFTVNKYNQLENTSNQHL